MDTRGKINFDEIKSLKDAKGIITRLELECIGHSNNVERARDAEKHSDKAFKRLKNAVIETARTHDLQTHYPNDHFGRDMGGEEKDPFSILITIAKEITELRTENDIFADFKDAILKRSEIKINPDIQPITIVDSQ